LEEARNGLDRLYTVIGRVHDRIGATNSRNSTTNGNGCWERFCEAMDDDFNTAHGIGILFDAARAINRMLDEQKESVSAEAAQSILSGLPGHIEK